MGPVFVEKIRAFMSRSSGAKGHGKSVHYQEESVASLPPDARKAFEIVISGPMSLNDINLYRKPSFAELSDEVNVGNLCRYGNCSHGCAPISRAPMQYSGKDSGISSMETLLELESPFSSLTVKSLDDVDSISSADSSPKKKALQAMGPGSTIRQWTSNLPAALSLRSADLPEGITHQDIETFKKSYEEHCKFTLGSCSKFLLRHIKSEWVIFWEGVASGAANQRSGEVGQGRTMLTRDKMLKLCMLREVKSYIDAVDLEIYERIVQNLVPELWTAVEASIAQEIWEFAERLEGWMKVAMEGYPEEMITLKQSSVTALSHELKNRIALNQLAVKLTLILESREKVSEMRQDLDDINFRSLEKEASWLCGPNEALFRGIKRVIEDPVLESLSMFQWTKRINAFADRLLPSSLNASDLFDTLREVLTDSFIYCQLILRDLEVKGKNSLELFESLLRVYYFYMLHLLKQRIAQAADVLPVAVTAKGFMKSFESSSSLASEGYKTSESSGCDSLMSPFSSPHFAVPTTATENIVQTPTSSRRWNPLRPSTLENNNKTAGGQSNQLSTPPTNANSFQRTKITPPFLSGRGPW